MQFRYHHLSRSTNRLEALLAFYQGLGCTLEKLVNDEAQQIRRAVLRLPGSDACLQLIERAAGVVSPAGLDWPDHLAFHTAKLELALGRCLALGASLEREPYRTPGGSLVAFVRDPDGHWLELVEKPDLT